MRRRLAAGIGALALGATAWSGTASADPKGEVITLDCDNGQTYDVVVPGRGEFTPGHDVASNTILVPVAFPSFEAVIRDAEGNLLAEFSDPPVLKGQSGKRLKDPVLCEFTIAFVNDGSDPEFPVGATFTGTGTVLVRVTPSR